MAAPSFIGAGAGVIIQTGGAAVTAAGSGVAVGDLVILQVLQDGTAASAVTYSAISGIANLAGTASSLTTLATDQTCGTLAKQHLRVGRATSTTCTVTATTTGDDLYCRIYVFRDVNTGTALTDVIENSTAGTFVNGSGATAAVTDTAVVTLGADRLALNFVAVDDDNPLGPFVGATGGVWSEAVAEFASATGTDGAIQLQIGILAPIAYWSTASPSTRFVVGVPQGGNEMQAQSFNSGAGGTTTTVQFLAEKTGAPTDNLVLEIHADASGSPSGTAIASASPIAGSALATTSAVITASIAATLSPGTTYWLVWSRTGSADTSNYFEIGYDFSGAGYASGATKHRVSGAWANTANPTLDDTFAISYGAAGTLDGGSYTMAAADNWGVIGFALKPLPSGPATLFGATSSAYGFLEVTAAQRRTTSSLAMPVAFAAVVAGQVSVPAVTHYGALAAPFAFDAATAARRRTTGTVALPVTFAKAVAGQRKTFGATATPLTFAKAVAASRRTFGALAAPFTLTAATAGIATTGAVTHYGQLAAPFTFAAVTQTRRRTTSSTAMPVTFGAIVQTRRRTTSSLIAPFAFGAVVASRKQYARTTTNIVFGEATAGRKKTYGAIVRPFTFGAVTAGIGYTGAATYFGATATTITFSKAVQGTKKTFGVVARPIVFAAVVQGRRTTRTQIAAVYTWSSTTQARRKTHATVAMPIQWLAVTRGVSTVGIQTYYGQLTAPFTFARVVQAQRRTFATTATPITFSAFTKGMLMAAILNYADDIRWGTIQADRVMVGTTQVWTPGEDL